MRESEVRNAANTANAKGDLAAPNVSVGNGGSGGTKQAQNAEQAAQAATAQVYFVRVVQDGQC